MISVYLLFKYLLNIDHQTFLFVCPFDYTAVAVSGKVERS